MIGRIFYVAAIGALVVVASRLPAGPPPIEQRAAPEAVKWVLDRLNQEPLKLLKATPDGQRNQVRFLLELTRPPRPTELFDWEQHGGPVVFRFLDEDGIVLQTVKPQLEGELVPKTGYRMRLLLSLPNARVLEQTRSIQAD
jgi:hypothetical protein